MTESPLGKKERSESEIIALNLEKMDTEMLNVLLTESVGGNAGRVEIEGKKYSCAAINGKFNRITGEVAVFGNLQDRPVRSAIEADHESVLRELTFTIAVGYGGFLGRIIKTGCEGSGIEEKARGVTERSVEEYNKSKII